MAAEDASADLDAHRLLPLVDGHGGVLRDRVAEKVLHAHFRAHLNISDRRLLRGIAERAGSQRWRASGQQAT